MLNHPLLEDAGRFEAAPSADRLALAASVASLAGPDFRALDELVGSKRMAAVEHVATGLQFVVVPGGRFTMGLTEHDVARAEAVVDLESGSVQARLAQLEECCSPVREVVVAPFLLATTLATYTQLMTLTSNQFGETTSMPDGAEHLKGLLRDLRLPSEAELEYAAREGGAVSFVGDLDRAWGGPRCWVDETAWGLRDMLLASWAADEWHDSYEGAPQTSAPWTSGGSPGVYRGSLLHSPEDSDQLLFGLAAARGRLTPPDDEWDIAFRFARTLG